MEENPGSQPSWHLLFSYLFLLFISVKRVFTQALTVMHVWSSEFILSFHHMGSGNQTRVDKLGGKLLYPLSLLLLLPPPSSSPSSFFLSFLFLLFFIFFLLLILFFLFSFLFYLLSFLLLFLFLLFFFFFCFILLPLFFFFFSFFFLAEPYNLGWLQTHSVTEHDLELMILLPPPSKSFSYRHVPSCSVLETNLGEAFMHAGQAWYQLNSEHINKAHHPHQCLGLNFPF